jgi:hypothetical protein
MENRIVIVNVQTPTATPTEAIIISPRREEEKILLFSESMNMDPEWLLTEILNDDDLIISESWCDTVRELIRKQPEKHIGTIGSKSASNLSKSFKMLRIDKFRLL